MSSHSSPVSLICIYLWRFGSSCSCSGFSKAWFLHPALHRRIRPKAQATWKSTTCLHSRRASFVCFASVRFFLVVHEIVFASETAAGRRGGAAWCRGARMARACAHVYENGCADRDSVDRSIARLSSRRLSRTCHFFFGFSRAGFARTVSAHVVPPKQYRCGGQLIIKSCTKIAE